MAVFNLVVNGEARSVDVEPDTPLLWVLRDALDLLGTKFGCGGGFCGACTVHIDGVARRSCLTTVADVGLPRAESRGLPRAESRGLSRAESRGLSRAESRGAGRVTTIEGLSADGTHAVQRAWEEIDVAQCGYCQAGQIMTAAALLARTPNPSDAEIANAMNGNICRCATYMRIRIAVRRAATLASEARKTQ